jgi:hypothetical protein
MSTTIDLSQPTSAFTGAHVQNTVSEPDVSDPIVILINPQPVGNPSATGIFDALKDVTTRNMIFRLENKNAAGTAFLAAPELRSYAGTYADFTQDGFEIRSDGQTPATWGIYHRKSDGKDGAGNALAGYVYKNVVYGFDLEHKFTGFQSMVQASRQAKLTAANFIDAADLNHTTGQQHKKVSPLTEADSLASLEVYECTSDGGANMESNTLRIKPGAESADKTLTYNGADLSGAITAAALGPFADAVKTKLDDNKSTIQFDTLVQRTKNIQSIAANATSTATQEIKIQHPEKFPRSDIDITGAVFNATQATIPLTIGAATVPSNNGTAPSQALAFKASIGTAATARVETVTIEDKEYGTPAVRNSQLLLLNQARFAAQTTSEAMPETRLTVAPVDTTPKTVTVKVGGTDWLSTVINAQTYNVSTAASGSLTFQNAGSWGNPFILQSLSFTFTDGGTNGTTYSLKVGYKQANGSFYNYEPSFTPANGNGTTKEDMGGLLRAALNAHSNLTNDFTISGTGATVTVEKKTTGVVGLQAGAGNLGEYDELGNIITPITTITNTARIESSATQDGQTSGGYLIGARTVYSNSNLSITVQGYAAKTFTIGGGAGGYSTTAELATAVAAAFDVEDGLSAVKVGTDTVTFSKTTGDFTIDTNSVDTSVTTGTTTQQTNNYVAAGDYTSPTDLAKAIQSGISLFLNIHADLDPDNNGDNTIVNIRGTKKTNGSMDFTQTIDIQITQTGGLADTTVRATKVFSLYSNHNSGGTSSALYLTTAAGVEHTITSVATNNNTVIPQNLKTSFEGITALSGYTFVVDANGRMTVTGPANGEQFSLRGNSTLSGRAGSDLSTTDVSTTNGAAATGRCDAFLDSGAGAFPSGMTHTVFGSDLSTGSGFEYSVRVGTSGDGTTRTVAAGKADVDAVLDDIHTTFNNASNFSRTEKVLLEGKFDGPANLTKKIALADSSGDISGGSATEKLCLFDFEPVIGNKATASGDFTTPANAVSAPFKAKVKLGGFVALCNVDNEVLSYLEVIPGYVIEGNAANTAKLESYDTSANPFLTKINGASAEVTVNNPGAVQIGGENIGAAESDTHTVFASRIGSALIKADVIAAFEKGSENGSGFTQAYTGSTIRVYYADGTANASLAHNDGNAGSCTSGSLTFRNAANWGNHDLSITVDGITATFYIGAGAQYNTLNALAHAVESHVSFNTGTMSAVSDGTDTVTFTKTDGIFAISSNNIDNAVSATAGNYASASSVNKIAQANPISALQFAERGVDTLTIRSNHDDGNGNSSVSVTVGVYGGGDATNAATAAVKFVEGFTAAKKTAGKFASVSASANVLTFTGIAEGADAVTFELKDGSGNALNANNPLATVNTTPYANGTHETVTFKYGTGENAPEWGPMTIGKAPKNGVAGAADHFLTSQAAADNFYAWAKGGGAGDLGANVDKITGVALQPITHVWSETLADDHTGWYGNNPYNEPINPYLSLLIDGNTNFTLLVNSNNGIASDVASLVTQVNNHAQKPAGMEATGSGATLTITYTQAFTVKAKRPLVLSDNTVIAANTVLNATETTFSPPQFVPRMVTISGDKASGAAPNTKSFQFTKTGDDNDNVTAKDTELVTGTAANNDIIYTITATDTGIAASGSLTFQNADNWGNHDLSITVDGITATFYIGAGAQYNTLNALAHAVAGHVSFNTGTMSAVSDGMDTVTFTKTDGNFTIDTNSVDTSVTTGDTQQQTANYVAPGNSTIKTIRCGHSTNITKKTVEGVDSLHCNTTANIRDYIVDAVCNLGAMIESKAANGTNVTLSGRANGKPFAVTITAADKDGNAVDITANNHLDVGDLVVGTDIGQITYTTQSEHGIFTGDSVTLKEMAGDNAANNGTFVATRVDGVDNQFSVVLTGILSTAGFASGKVDNNATRSIKLQFKKGNDTGSEQTITLTGTATNVRDVIVATLNAEGVKNEGSKGYASLVAAKANSDDTLVITSTAPTSYSDDQTFIIKVTDVTNVDAIDLADGDNSVSALGSTLFNTTVIDVGAGHGILANDVVTVAGTTSNDLATKVVVAVNGPTISLAETGTEQQAAGGTVKVHNLLDMTMQNTLGLSLKNGAALKLGPATVFDNAVHVAANFGPAATMKDVIQEFWTYTKNGHGLVDGDLVQQLSETGFEVEIARGVFARTDNNSGAIRQVKGRFETNDAFVLKKSTGGGAFTALSGSASTELALTSTSITGATKAMFRKLQDGTEMDTQGKFEVGNYYVLNTGVQVLKAAITGANAADFGLNTTTMGIQKEYDFKLEAGALSVLSGPAAQADVLKSGIITFTVSSGMYEGDFGTGESEVIQFVLKHDGATGGSNDANWGYYSSGTAPDNTQTKTLAGLTRLNTGSTVATNGYSISFQSGNKLDGSGTFSSASNASVKMKNSNNDEIEFGTATFSKSTTTTGAIDMTLNLDKNTFLLDSDMEFEFTLKLVADNIPAGIPTEDATVYVLYKFTNFQKPYALHSNQDLANRATWRTLSDTANASIADFSMIGETPKAVNDNFYVASRTQAQLLDIDGLTWAYDDNTAGEEKYTASISLSDAKSVQISNYGRLGADIHADLKALKAGAGDSFSVPVQVDFLNKAVKGGFTKKNGDDQTLHYSTLSITDEVRDPDSVKIHTLDVAYTAGTSVVLTIKCGDADQKSVGMKQISDNYPANMSTNRKAPFGTSARSGEITQFVSMDGVAIAAGNLANTTRLPMTSGNFQLQIDLEASSVALTSTTTQANIDGKKRLTVDGDISLNNALAIAAGTQIIFQNNTSKLTGALTCTGTATDPIVFQSGDDSIDDVGKGAPGRESNWKSVSLAAGSNCNGCVFLGGGNGEAGTVITNGAVTMTNCAIFNSAAKSISVASGSPTLDFITVGNNATDAPDVSPTNLMTLTAGVMVKSNGSGTDTFAAANREWFATQNRVDMHLSYAVPGSYNLTKNADQGAGAFIFYRSSLAGGINVFRMNSASKSCVARAVSLYNPALVTLDQAADLSFARRTALTDQTIGTLKLDGAALNLKDGTIPAGIYVYLDKENTQGTLSRNLDTGVIQLSRSATEIPSKITVTVSNSNRGIFDVDSKDDLAPINLTYTEDPNLEVKHHEKVVNPFRKVIEGGDYTGAIDVAGMTQVIIDGPVVLKGAGASLTFDANTDVVMIERDRTPTTGVLSMRADELLASIDDNTGFAEGTYYAELTGGDGTGGKVKIVVGAGEVGAITSLDVTHQGSEFADGNTLTVGTATRDEDDNNDLGKDLTITLTASDVANVYPYDMSGIIENGGQVSFGAGCVVRTNTDYQLSKANNTKVLGMVCGSTTNPTKRFYINRELVSLAVEAPTGNAADMFFVPCRMGSCDEATLSQPLSHANRLTDAIRLPATVDDYSCTDVALVDQALTINATKTLRVEPGARLVGHKSIAEKIAGSAMGAKTVTVTGTLKCLGFDSTNAAELHGLNVAGAGSIQLRHALVTLLGDSDKIDFNTADADSFIDRVEIKATASGSRAAGLNFGANLNTRASVLEARQIKMDGAPIQVETNNLLLQDCDVLNIHSSKYGVKVTTYGSTIRKIRVNGEKLVEGATGTLLNSVQNGTFMKDVEQGIVGASEGAFENDLVIHKVAAAAFNARARLYAEKEANDNSIALTKSLTAADGFVDARVDAALAAYDSQRAGFGGAAIADRAALRAAIAMEGAADYFMHVGQTYAKDVDQLAVKESTTKMAELFLGHMILNGELLSRVEVALSVESATANVFDDDSLTRTIVAATEKCTFKGSIATTAFTFTQKPILLVNGGLRDAQSTQSDPHATNASATNSAVEFDGFNAYATLGNQIMNYASVTATGNLGTPAKKRVLVSQSDLYTVTISAALDGTSNYKYDPYIIQSEYGRLDKGAYNLARSAGDLAYIGIFGSRGVALTANDNHVAILHTLGNAASGTLKNTYIEDCTGHAIAGAGVLNTRVECVDYGDRLCSGDITQNGAVLYAESEKAPRGSEASQFGSTNDVTDIQAPHKAFFTKSAGSSFGALSDVNRFAHWWNPLKTFTAAYPFHDLTNTASQAIVYGYLQADGTPAILNGGEAARLSATQIGATKFYELKKAAATPGAPKVHYKTAGSNAVEVSMAAELTLAENAALQPTHQNSSDGNVTTKRTDRTANGDTIPLERAQLTLDNTALWGAKKQVVTATPPSGSYNELLLPANDAVEGSVQFASKKSIPTGDYVFKRIEYAVAKDLQYGAQGSMNPSPRGFTLSDTQTLKVTVEQQPKLQLFAKGAGAEAKLDADRTRILRHSQLNQGTTDIKAIVRVNIVNPDTISNISVIDPANQPKFTASDTKVVSVAGQHAAADATGQKLVLKLNETAGAYSGANNGLTVQNVMEGEVADSEFGTQSVTIQSVTDIATVDIDGTYFDTTNNNTHMVCRNKWYDLAIAPSPNVRSIAVNVNSSGTRPLAGDSRCTITATDTLGNSDALTDFIGDWTWTPDGANDSKIDTLTGTLSLPAQSETFGTGANTALSGDQTFNKPVVIIEGEVTITNGGNVIVGANVDQILFKDNANLIITGNLTIDRDDLAKPVLVRHIDDHTLQFCQGEFKGIDVAGNGTIKGLMIVGGTNQLKVGGGTLGGDTAAKGIRLINGCEKALQITGELSGHCQNVYIRGAKVGLEVSGLVSGATHLKDIRIDDCLNNALTLNSDVSIGNIFVNSPSEPRDSGMSTLMGTAIVTLLSSTTQYMAADTRNQGSLTGITSWTTSAGDSEGTGQYLQRLTNGVPDPIFTNLTFDFTSIGLSAGDSFSVSSGGTLVGTFTVSSLSWGYVKPTETTGLVDQQQYVLSVGNPVASGLVNSASTPVVNYNQAAGADRMATLKTMGYVPDKDISTTAQVQYKEEYSHYYTDANMTASARTSTDATNSYKIQTKEYMQGLRFSADQYTATKSAGNTADISGNANKVHKDATLAWANNALTALQLFTGTSSRATGAITSIAKATSSSITMPTIANNPDEYDLETLPVAAKYDFARLKINATPASTSATETKSASYSMFSTLAVYGDAPQFRILSKGSGADTNYIGANAHNWLFAGSTVGSSSPMVVLTFGDMPSGLEYDIPVTQSGSGASGRVYGIDNTNKKLLVGEVTGTFVTTENVLVNGADSSQAPTAVDKDNRLMKTANVSMGFALNEAENGFNALDFNNSGMTAPQTLSYTMQNEAYLSVLDAHPFGIGDKRHANYTFGTTDGHVMETHGSNYLSRSGPTLANNGEIVITQKDAINLPNNDNTNDLIKVGNFSMPNAMTLSGTDSALSLQNLTNALTEVRGCIRPHLHTSFDASQADPMHQKSGYSSAFATTFARLVAQTNSNVATLNVTPALPGGTNGANFAVAATTNDTSHIDHIQVFGGAAPDTGYTGQNLADLKDGYLIEFDRGLQTGLVGESALDANLAFAKSNNDVTITLDAHGLVVGAFVVIKGAAVAAGNRGLFQITAKTDNTFTITNPNGVDEAAVGKVEEQRDLGLQLALDNSGNTILTTRQLNTTLAVRPGLQYKVSFGNGGANGTFTFRTQYFPKIQKDPTLGVIAGEPKMIDGLGTTCANDSSSFPALNAILSQHASYIGPMGGMCLVENLSIQNFSQTMEHTPKLFKLPDQKLDNTSANGKTGVLEIQDDASARANGFNAKFKTDCCIYVQDQNIQYALKKANAAHADSQSVGVLTAVSGAEVLRVGDTITDGDGSGSGEVQKIVITKVGSSQTIQIQMSATTDIKDTSASGDTLKVGSSAVFTHGSNMSWTVGNSYYKGSARPIPDGNMVLFAHEDNSIGGRYGLLKAGVWNDSTKTMTFVRTTDKGEDERIPQITDLANGNLVLYLDTGSIDANLANTGVATFKSGHQKAGSNNQFKVVDATTGERPDKLLIMGLSTHGIRTNSNGVYENAPSKYFLHMRMDNKEVQGGELFVNKVVYIDTALAHPYSMMRTTTVGNNSSADLQMSNVIRGTQKEAVAGFTTRPYETKELEVVGIDMSSNASVANNPAHWGGDRPTTRTQDLCGILIVNPDELTEHGSPYVQNTDGIRGALQALKRPSFASVVVTGNTGTKKVTFAITNNASLPADGKIVLTVPSTFTFAAAPAVEASIDGGLTAATVGNTITITRNGAGNATAANSAASITVTATALGANGTDGFEIYTTDSSGTILESDFKSRAITI